MQKFIVIEGNTCTGKTTLASRLVTNLNKFGFQSIYMKMLPSDTDRGRNIKDSLGNLSDLDMDILYLEDFYLSVSEAEYLMKAGNSVIMDRYMPSFLSFCKTYRTVEEFERLKCKIDDKITKKPDFTFFLYANDGVKVSRLLNKKDTSSFDKSSLGNSQLENNLREIVKDYAPIYIDTSYKSEKDVLDICLNKLLVNFFQ